MLPKVTVQIYINMTMGNNYSFSKIKTTGFFYSVVLINWGKLPDTEKDSFNTGRCSS